MAKSLEFFIQIIDFWQKSLTFFSNIFTVTLFLKEMLVFHKNTPEF